MEAALKTSFTREVSLKVNPLSYVDDSSAFNLPNATVSDDFSVDELLDFSHLEEPLEDEQHHQKTELSSLSPPPVNPCHQVSNFDIPSLPSTELNVPADDLANLEWLSHFVEDSFAVQPTTYPTEKPKPKSQTEQKPEKIQTFRPCFKTPVPAKARSKRTRNGLRVWPFRNSTNTSITESSSSSTSSSSSSSPTSPLFVSAGVSPEMWPPAAKRVKKGVAAEGSGGTRRCSHCGVHKTPQWRTGPMGAKTLCNACGVRFKSGRLLPEYRPACSPTFSSDLHSNHHRKVLEMRRQKEGLDGGEGILGTPVVKSFG